MPNSSVRVVAKYCIEHVCEHISQTKRAIFTIFLCMVVARLYISGVTKFASISEFVCIIQKHWLF